MSLGPWTTDLDLARKVREACQWRKRVGADFSCLDYTRSHAQDCETCRATADALRKAGVL